MLCNQCFSERKFCFLNKFISRDLNSKDHNSGYCIKNDLIEKLTKISVSFEYNEQKSQFRKELSQRAILLNQIIE